MPTLVRDPPPAEFEALLKRRQQLGLDLLDEVWEGVYHMNPAPSGRHGDIAQQLAEILGPLARAANLRAMVNIFNLGEPDDYRVPDGGLHRAREDRVYYPTAALVIEIVSPGDETWDKLDFYAAHEVAELLIIDVDQREVHWLGLTDDGRYSPLAHSGLVDLDATALADRLDWPA